MRPSAPLRAALASLLVAGACGDPGREDDGGAPSADAGADAAIPDDAGHVDDGADAGPRDDDAGADPGDAGPDAGDDDDGGAPDGDAGVPLVDTALAPAGGLRLLDPGPARTADAPGDDVDLDGLRDAFEDRVLEALRPVLFLADDEPALTDGSVIALVGRVFPSSLDPLVVRAFVMIGWSEDYGSCGFTFHHGDSERFAVELQPTPDVDGALDVVRVYTAAHEGTPTDRGRVFAGAALQADVVTAVDPTTGAPRLAFFPSLRKHATYANPTLCDEAFILPCVKETCASDTSGVTLVPAVVNAGEEGAPRVDALDDVGFPGESAWAEQDFCGGLGGIGCSSAVREKLLNDPFAE